MGHFNITHTMPTGSGDTTIFDSSIHATTGIANLGIASIAFGVMHDQAGTLKAYRRAPGQTTWDLYDSRAVAIPAANTISGPFDYDVQHYTDWKLVWTNGGTNQTVWRPELTFTERTWETL